MHWLVDGYNVIRGAPELAVRERESLGAARTALCRRLSTVARLAGERFTVVFDGARAGSAPGGEGVRVIFSSTRETADQVLGRLAGRGTAVVSNDREVRQAAARAGAVAVTADEFLARVSTAPARVADKDDEGETRPAAKKGNPRRLPKKARRRQHALRRLGPF